LQNVGLNNFPSPGGRGLGGGGKVEVMPSNFTPTNPPPSRGREKKPSPFVDNLGTIQEEPLTISL
jgi:hypothetical protein